MPPAVIGNSIEAVQREIAISRENAGCSCVTNASNSGAVDTVMLAIVVSTSAVVPLLVVPTILGPTNSGPLVVQLLVADFGLVRPDSPVPNRRHYRLQRLIICCNKHCN